MLCVSDVRWDVAADSEDVRDEGLPQQHARRNSNPRPTAPTTADFGLHGQPT